MNKFIRQKQKLKFRKKTGTIRKAVKNRMLQPSGGTIGKLRVAKRTPRIERSVLSGSDTIHRIRQVQGRGGNRLVSEDNQTGTPPLKQKTEYKQPEKRWNDIETKRKNVISGKRYPKYILRSASEKLLCVGDTPEESETETSLKRTVYDARKIRYVRDLVKGVPKHEIRKVKHKDRGVRTRYANGVRKKQQEQKIEKMRRNHRMRFYQPYTETRTMKAAIQAAVKEIKRFIQEAGSHALIAIGAALAPLLMGSVILFTVLFLLAAVFGENPGYSATGEAIAAYAVSFVGKIPYYYGTGREYQTLEDIVAAGATSDCSAYTERVYRHFGFEIGSTTYTQMNVGIAVADMGELIPGDLLLFNNHGSGPQPGHVGIYIGNGQVVHEGGGNIRGNVKIDALSYFTVMYIRRLVTDIECEAIFEGDSNAEICWNFFRSQGFSEEATAGILGNFWQESGFDPAIQQYGGGSGHGLGQWGDSRTGGRFYQLQSFAKSRGMEWFDLEAQLLFVMYELQGSIQPYFKRYVGGVETFKACEDIDEAVHLWLVCYEMLSDNYNSLAAEGTRKQYAHAIYRRFAG